MSAVSCKYQLLGEGGEEEGERLDEMEKWMNIHEWMLYAHARVKEIFPRAIRELILFAWGIQAYFC